MNKHQMTVSSPSTRGLMDSSHPQTVLSRLSEQRSQGMFCDVTIVVEDVKFRAHRNVLAATSGYFRNAFTSPEIFTSGQVLELLDLRSEVFATILNFIYSSKVASLSTEDTKSLVAAGKRLGIPFLEKLMEDRQGSGLLQGQALGNQQQQNSNPSSLKKETPRLEESDCTKGPRITNAFSITEVGAGNNPFTPLDSRNGGRQSPDMGNLPSGCPAPSVPSVENETTQALSEHSYAVSQGPKSTDFSEGGQGSDKKANRPTPVSPRTLSCRNFGPIKKRHRLHCATPKSISTPSDTPSIPVLNSDSCPVLQKAVVSPDEEACSRPLLAINPEPETDPVSELDPLDENPSPTEPEPPSLSPHENPDTPEYHCEYCPNIFSNRALLTLHMQIHKKRFVSHLYCKYCCRRFMHLKRLRNHEQVCNRAQRSPPQLEPNDKETTTDHNSNGMSHLKETQSLPSLDLQDSFTIDPTLENPVAMHGCELDRVKKGAQRAHKCSVCKRAYVTLSSLKRHENVHSWHRAYPCHYCNKVFALAEYRTKHEIWHTGERRYQCIFCLETFMTYYILKNHQKAFHGIDPRLAVNKKSANGGFKNSVYPIKLYRLLPMKFRKRRYKTYRKTYGEDENDQAFSTALGRTSPTSPFESVGGQSLFSMPVTFMATPKTMAVGMPRIGFGQPLDQNMTLPIHSDEDMPQSQDFLSADTEQDDALSEAENSRSSLMNYKYTNPSGTQRKKGSSVLVHGHNVESPPHKTTFPDVNSATSTERVGNRLGNISAIEAMAGQLFLPGTESLGQEKSVGGKTETYIAKPACPGPSIDSHVLPLCQITVKIGNEAIIRRKIKGSKLFPKKRKRKIWNQMEGKDVPRTSDEGVGCSSLCQRTEATASTLENEPYDDLNDRDTGDNLWRPYYSYKPKKKGKKLRSKHRQHKSVKYYARMFSPQLSENLTETGFGSDMSVPAHNTDLRRSLRSNSPKTTHACDICKGLFTNESSLRMHLISCHQYFCQTCGKQCLPEDASSFGSPLADESREFVCKSCMEDGSCFDNSAPGPSTEKRYRCSFCPQRFLYLATKRSHEKKHLEKSGKGYSCQYCPKVCKSAAHRAVHEKKHFIKTEEHEDLEQAEMDVKDSAIMIDSYTGDKGEPKSEPWDNSDISTQAMTKAEASLHDKEISHEKISSSENPFLLSLSELQQKKKHKRKRMMEFPKTFSSQSNKDSIGLVTSGQKGPLPILGTNSYCSSRMAFPNCLTRDPVTKGSTHPEPTYSLSKSQHRLCKEEIYFHDHN
ncbi:zinc finger and BTB domain-containing protein 38 isoform X2 [Denticeps clupeoides]|uniref:Zinc finger and BTB domain-containing protein 38 n=1 Tax=Denticeps clupeoides TaxID=299321 RepID=A0AAY4CGI2_9TELE|nr:zinc finger and BTB domain-containing protein 38 isoform X2 [Denticeps clupeoides]XP_028817822.1 zinc finger and BTB domain-containing protein 38 isoform X2 [Denticeps clupeoides]XP_028817824.1 zinc finger and BTB domain-containing protein 38 isoform X2 [Denticeps clupeoides]